ncbi:hypothetical protein V8F33_012335 [Rhypophila sp. PSN 637]
MESPSHNHEISETKITPIQYEPDFPFKYNNFVYRCSLPVDISNTPRDAGGKPAVEQPKSAQGQPGCVPIPAGTREFIIRLRNPDAESMHQETRVQNEVAILTLASAALRHIEPNIVPWVFGWGPGALQGPSKSLEEKKNILGQMARILKGLQDYPLPSSIQGWGGLTFDDNGVIISSPMPSVGAGPWPSLEESYRARLKVALGRVEENPHLKGWHFNGIRERIEKFIESGLAKQLAELESSHERAIIHADFTSDNLLYDPETGRITALLDYDFSSINHPAYEFFRSFNRLFVRGIR